MRRALALAAAVVSARQDHLCAEDVCFYHVPKTGGDSFKYLLRDELKRRGRTFWSNEWCPRRSNGTSTMVFREPRAHVVSQYFECRDSEWALGNRAKWEALHGAFPRNSTKRDPYAGFKKWIRHFATGSQDDFGCYDPRDMQARYVACSCERTCAHHLTQHHPTPARAAAGLAALDVVGVMEHFDASACLVMDAAGLDLPDACFCDTPSSFTGARYHVAHGLARHSPRDLDQETLAAIDALTALDRHLYNAARRRFAKRVLAVEARLGRRILCE